MATTPNALVVPGYEIRRWRRFGHDRLYVAVTGAAEGEQLGYRDLATGTDHPVHRHDHSLLAGIADAWVRQADGGSAPTVAADPVESRAPETPAPVERPWVDLSRNEPGRSAQSQASVERSRAPVRTSLARALRVHTPERAWRIGAKGERLVADELTKLARRDSRWTAIHAVPVGSRGADIDHLLIGPGGVFTLNAKHHPDAEVWAGGDTVIVNGTRVPYVRNARHEAARATRLLSAAVGRPVTVTGVVVPVGCQAPITQKAQPRDAYVVTRRDLVAWASSLGQVWAEADLAAIWEAARRSTTWAD